MHRIVSLSTAVLALALVGCTAPTEPDASASPTPSPSPSTSPSASAAPTSEPEVPAEPADPTADWVREDLGWASIPLPDGWALEERGSAEWMVVSDGGFDMVSVFRVPEGQYAQDLVCPPEDLPAFEAVETLPFSGAEGATAGAWASARTVVEVGTTMQELQIGFDGEVAFVVQMGISEAQLLGAESCEPFFAVVPADGIASGILVVEDPEGGLRFDTRDAALAYLDTDEHRTLTDLLLGIRIR